MPVFLTRWNPDHVALPDFVYRGPDARAGAFAWKSGSTRTVPVKFSVGAFREG